MCQIISFSLYLHVHLATYKSQEEIHQKDNTPRPQSRGKTHSREVLTFVVVKGKTELYYINNKSTKMKELSAEASEKLKKMENWNDGETSEIAER